MQDFKCKIETHYDGYCCAVCGRYISAHEAFRTKPDLSLLNYHELNEYAFIDQDEANKELNKRLKTKWKDIVE